MRQVLLLLLFCKTISFVMLSLVFSVGCQQNRNAVSSFINAEAKEEGIINGDIVTERTNAEARSVVIFELLNFRSEHFLYCTGVLIGPHTVLTAAHCFGPKKTNTSKKFRILFGNSFTDSEKVQTNIGKSFLTHPQYQSEEFEASTWEQTGPKPEDHKIVVKMVPVTNNDLAVAVFNGNLPKGYAPVGIETNTETNFDNQLVEVFGYGRSIDYIGTDLNEDLLFSVGTLRSGTLRIRDDYQKISDRYYVVSTENNQFICQGDSGGPQFLLSATGQPKVIGINSGIVSSYLPNGLQKCSAIGEIAKVPHAAKWIRETEKKLLRK